MKEPSKAAMAAAEAILQLADVNWKPLVQLTEPGAKAPGQEDLAEAIDRAWEKNGIILIKG